MVDGEADGFELMGDTVRAGSGSCQAEGFFAWADGEDGVGDEPELADGWRLCARPADRHCGRPSGPGPGGVVGVFWTVTGLEVLRFGEEERGAVKIDSKRLIAGFGSAW